jgi:two-component system nitrogen regulation response regulator NtrX
MPLETQGKILRVLLDQTFERVGGSTRVQVDVRVVSATSRDLAAEIAARRFREDLFHRLNVVPLRIPAVRERREDVPALAQYFMKREAEALGLPARVLGDDALAALQRAEWPGNVRELRNLIARLLILAPDDPRRVIGADVLPPDLPPGRAVPRADRDHQIMTLPLREAREIFEREYLAAQINRFGGNISRTATFVGMERSALHRKLKTLGVQGEDRLAGA